MKFARLAVPLAIVASALLAPAASAAPAAQEADRGVAATERGVGLNLGLNLGVNLGGSSSYERGAVLTGAAEVPGPGDPDGYGTARIEVRATSVCVKLSTRRIGEATAAHIHAGATGESGPPVVTLDPPVDGYSWDCARISLDLAYDLVAHPRDFYVNVHTDAFPDGAIRGQLRW
ncbi:MULTISPECIES: CHRD domain-containing protein [Actinosynnema]|uniref:CHRD domain-containing protein n=1 Tax=Actinosynnema TaxID=40566 RepID=UPI0020A24E5D|nr:CHRD domain-containing protein [Actinosynnema pretiosum]MCP2092707.1 CHRD domain-containing protein [Actinosynnema pretiosum]